MSKKPSHVYEDECRNKYCKIHWVYSFKYQTQLHFPEDFMYLSSINGWIDQTVYCGPGAFYPKKEKR